MAVKEINEENYFETGIKSCAQGKIEKAMIAFEHVLENDPNYMQAQKNLKWISYWYSAEYDEIISKDQNRWQPGKKMFSKIFIKRG
ncbi:MAG: hypothetical protein H8E61_05345 [Bacteroidetes bacterium]|nr:hypothetical protein [Bacteroidota bacterium]